MINLDKKESHETDHYQKNIVKYFKDYNFNGKYYRDVFEVKISFAIRDLHISRFICKTSRIQQRKK